MATGWSAGGQRLVVLPSVNTYEEGMLTVME